MKKVPKIVIKGFFCYLLHLFCSNCFILLLPHNYMFAPTGEITSLHTTLQTPGFCHVKELTFILKAGKTAAGIGFNFPTTRNGYVV